MSLERKIPMIPAPKDAYNLTRCKVGKKLWTIDGPKLDFDLSDPYHYETQFSYEALHDRHLLGFFTRPINMRYLLKAGLITEDMSVKCSLYEYNVYRQYLRKIHGNRVGKELRKRDCLSAERRILRHAEEQARQQVDRCRFFLPMEQFIFLSLREIKRRLISRLENSKYLLLRRENIDQGYCLSRFSPFLLFLSFFSSRRDRVLLL